MDPNSITATTALSSYPARDFTTELQSDAWCAFTSDPSRNIIVHFESPVLVTAVLSSGENVVSGIFYYATNFTLEFYNETSNEFVPYTGLESEQPKV